MTIIFLYTFILFVTLCLITFLFVGIIIRSRGTIIITSFGIVIQTILFCFFFSLCSHKLSIIYLFDQYSYCSLFAISDAITV